MDLPTGIAFSPDGAALTYLVSEDGTNVRSLWWHDLATGRREVVVSGGAAGRSRSEASLPIEERLRRQRERETSLGVTRYRWSAAGSTLIVPLDGRLFVATNGSRATELPGVQGVQAAAVAPDGTRVAFVRGGEVHACTVGPGDVRQLTSDAADGVSNGLPDFAAAEELDRHDGLWWSGDGASLAWARVDERAIPAYALAGLTSRGFHVERHRYPFAGGPNARVRLLVAPFPAPGAASAGLPPPGTPVEAGLDMAEDDYLARVVPHPAGGWLVAVLPRAQRRLRWWRVMGDGAAHPLWEEASEPWLNLDTDTRVLADGRVLRTTERSGFRHLEIRDADGGLRALTAGTWMVTGLVGVSEPRGEAYILGTADGVVERHVYAVPLDAPRPVGRPVRLTREPGWHGAVFSRDGERWVDTWSTRREAPRVVARLRDGGEAIPVHAPSATAASLDLAVPELMEVTAADGKTRLHAALWRPAAAARPPLVVWVYGGPHSQYVREAWELTIHPTRQALAHAGFAVLVVDNRGTANRGLAFESAIAGRLGHAEADDQVAAVAELAARGVVDGSRVGITGGSYGGYMTIRCMERDPDRFTAGVAIAPVTDWTGYDTAYTERYLGPPGEHAAGYRSASAQAAAGRLRGALRLVHGELDENVHPWHSARLVAALRAAGGEASLSTIPGERHGFRSLRALLRRERVVVSHFEETLRPGAREVGGPGDATARGVRRRRTAG
jgi:dipeptidyl-peptidase-4